MDEREFVYGVVNKGFFYELNHRLATAVRPNLASALSHTFVCLKVFFLIKYILVFSQKNKSENELTRTAYSMISLSRLCSQSKAR